MRTLAALAVVTVVLATDCKKDSTGPPGPLDGTWSGGVSGQFTMDATLTDHAQSVTGSGDFNGVAIVNPPIIFTVAGTDDGVNFHLILTAKGYSGSVSYTGTVTNATTVSGTLTGGGFNATFDLVKN